MIKEIIVLFLWHQEQVILKDEYYIEKPSGHKLLSEQIKVEKELNEKLTRKMTIRNKLKEYDNLKKLLITLLNVKYPYISFCYGGFIHELISKFDISLLNHVPNCNLCKDNQEQNYLLNNFKMWKFNDKTKDEDIINTKEEEELKSLIKFL